jgi:hypothetical protein
MAETFNDSARTRSGSLEQPDAHGHAAMLLVESLIHGLIASSTISVQQAVDIVDIAVEANIGVVAGQDTCPESISKAQRLLDSISTSLAYDLPRP